MHIIIPLMVLSESNCCGNKAFQPWYQLVTS